MFLTIESFDYEGADCVQAFASYDEALNYANSLIDCCCHEVKIVEVVPGVNLLNVVSLYSRRVAE